MDEYKICVMCKDNLLISNFSKNKNKKDGLQDNCKGCAKIYRDKNKDNCCFYNSVFMHCLFSEQIGALVLFIHQ